MLRIVLPHLRFCDPSHALLVPTGKVLRPCLQQVPVLDRQQIVVSALRVHTQTIFKTDSRLTRSQIPRGGEASLIFGQSDVGARD